jgi:hypothetical protein
MIYEIETEVSPASKNLFSKMLKNWGEMLQHDQVCRDTNV